MQASKPLRGLAVKIKKPMKFKLIVCVFSMCWSLLLFAQTPQKPHSGELLQDLKALNFLGSVLYIAAHPDDENTRLISYMANSLHARTAYLSLTRGDGGQNLIGSEIGESLGLIRTHELLKARAIDGGEQYFTRAIDFGYSKTPKETLQIWNKDSVLADVIRTIRRFQPDIIINRFDHRTPGSTHGHHTSSAILGIEAFEKAAKSELYPKQLKQVNTWQPQRLFFNTSWWFYGSREAFEKADKSKLSAIDVGLYEPVLGQSINEIAAQSRSQHKSQGFGSTGQRGSQTEYLEIIKGDQPQNNNVFEGINTTWTRLQNGKAIQNILKPLEQEFDVEQPWKIVPQLLEARQLIQQLPNQHWKTLKLSQIDQLIKNCLGLFLEVKTSTETAYPGQRISIDLEAINRSPISAQLTSVEINNQVIAINDKLDYNKGITQQIQYRIPESTPLSSPYWLNRAPKQGLYHVADQDLIGLPLADEAISAKFQLLINGTKINYTKALVHKSNSSVNGEVYDYFRLVPEATLGFSGSQLSFNSPGTKEISVSIRANRDFKAAVLRLDAAEGWVIAPQQIKIDSILAGEQQTFNIKVKATPQSVSNDLNLSLIADGKTYNQRLKRISYEHVNSLQIVEEANIRLNKFDLKLPQKSIAYINGAGASIPENLEAVGLHVDRYRLAEVNKEMLAKYDVVITGLRLYNTNATIRSKQNILEDFVQKGGHLIIQYNTNRSLKMDAFQPLDFQLSRKRVTDETAEIRFLEPQHPVLNAPNLIKEADFEDWVQERGLYFAEDWDANFTPILSMNDPEEAPQKGALLIGNYGKGKVTYTGISFFRQLPANVQGAYKLLINMISL